MSRRRAPRAIRRMKEGISPIVGMLAQDSPAALPLVTTNVVVGPWERGLNRRANLASTLTDSETAEVNNLIDRRYESAERQTDDMALRMEQLERMYRAEWEESTHYDEEHIYLAKGREALQVVSAFLYGMVSQLPKLVEFQPTPRNLHHVLPMWRQAKLAEALTNYYFDDIWKIRHTVIRDFIKVFLKFPSAHIRVDYHESAHDPDLRFKVVDRALQYIDPHAHRASEAKWWIEKEFWERSAVQEMFDRGHWHRPYDLPDMVPSVMMTGTDDAVMRRFFGSNYNSNIPVETDDLVEVWIYRQAQVKGLDDRYAVRLGGLGGWLVRYGPNPFPGPEIPYCGDSFDRHEWQIDGHGLLEMHEALQEVINTVLNLRLDDLRESVWSPAMVPEDLITDQTIQDIEDRQKLIRGNKEVIQWYAQNKIRLQDLFSKLPINDKESTHLYQDLAFLLGQNQQVGHSSDVFRGQTPSKVTTAQEIQEALTNNQGVFRPAFMSVMTTIEEAAQITTAYFRNRDFFGEERIILATGGRYQDVVKAWDVNQDGVRAAAVKFDDMNVDMTISAINGADAMLSRTFKAAVIKEMLASIGQVEGLFEELRDRFDFVPLIIDLFRSVSSDIDQFERSDEDAAKIAKARMDRQRQAQAQQIETESLAARAIEGAKSEREVRSIQTRASADAAKEAAKMSQDFANQLKLIVAQEGAQMRREVQLMLQEHLQKMQEMRLEQKLEIEAQTQGADAAVGAGQSEVKTSK